MGTGPDRNKGRAEKSVLVVLRPARGSSRIIPRFDSRMNWSISATERVVAQLGLQPVDGRAVSIRSDR